MDLNTYARTIIGDPTFQTKTHLVVPQGLLFPLQQLREVSENEIREWGAPILWQGNALGLQVGNGFRGGREGVNWDPNFHVGIPNRIGSFHSHPYRKKLSPKAAVGFSIGDVVFYAETYPANYGVGINFVTSGNKLFLAVYRQSTRLHIDDNEKHGLETDENEAEAYLAVRLGPQWQTLKANAEILRDEAELEMRRDDS